MVEFFDFKQERMTTEQAADYSGLSKKTLTMYRTTGKGPKFTKLGSRVFYVKKEVDAWIEANSGLISTSQAQLRKGGQYGSILPSGN